MFRQRDVLAIRRTPPCVALPCLPWRRDSPSPHRGRQRGSRPPVLADLRGDRRVARRFRLRLEPEFRLLRPAVCAIPAGTICSARARRRTASRRRASRCTRSTMATARRTASVTTNGEITFTRNTAAARRLGAFTGPGNWRSAASTAARPAVAAVAHRLVAALAALRRAVRAAGCGSHGGGAWYAGYGPVGEPLPNVEPFGGETLGSVAAIPMSGMGGGGVALACPCPVPRWAMPAGAAVQRCRCPLARRPPSGSMFSLPTLFGQ